MAEDESKSPELKALNELNKRMQVVIALLFRMVQRDSPGLPLKEQIAILDNLGIRPIEIAAIVGRKPKHINKELVSIRRKANKT